MSFRILDFLEHGFQSFLKFSTSLLRQSGLPCRGRSVFGFSDCPGHRCVNSLGQSLGYCGFSDPGFPISTGLFWSSWKHLDQSSDSSSLPITRSVFLPVPVVDPSRIFPVLQTYLRDSICDPLPSPNVFQCFQKFFTADRMLLKQASCRVSLPSSRIASSRCSR